MAGGPAAGQHFSVREALPELLSLLAREDLRATFFVEGLNGQLYPEALDGLRAAGPRGRLPRLAPRAVARGLRRGRAAGAGARRARRPGRLPPARRAAERAHAGDPRRARLPLLLAGRLARGPARRDRGAAVPLGADRRLLLRAALRSAAEAQRRPRGADGAGRVRERMLAALDAHDEGHLVLLFHPFLLSAAPDALAVVADVLARAAEFRCLRMDEAADASPPEDATGRPSSTTSWDAYRANVQKCYRAKATRSTRSATPTGGRSSSSCAPATARCGARRPAPDQPPRRLAAPAAAQGGRPGHRPRRGHAAALPAA